MTINEIRAKHPEWTDATVIEAWLHDVYREGGMDAVEDLGYGYFEFDVNGEVTVCPGIAARMIRDLA